MPSRAPVVVPVHDAGGRHMVGSNNMREQNYRDGAHGVGRWAGEIEICNQKILVMVYW